MIIILIVIIIDASASVRSHFRTSVTCVCVWGPRLPACDASLPAMGTCYARENADAAAGLPARDPDHARDEEDLMNELIQIIRIVMDLQRTELPDQARITLVIVEDRLQGLVEDIDYWPDD